MVIIIIIRTNERGKPVATTRSQARKMKKNAEPEGKAGTHDTQQCIQSE